VAKPKQHGVKTLTMYQQEKGQGEKVTKPEVDVNDTSLGSKSSSFDFGHASVVGDDRAGSPCSGALRQRAGTPVRGNNGIQLLWMPRCTRTFSPIEQAWAPMKQDVSWKYGGSRGIIEACEQAHDGFYTNLLAA
jgi:hypothetical protein